MKEITDKELYHRLDFIKQTRLMYLKQYGIDKKDVVFTYDTLDSLNDRVEFFVCDGRKITWYTYTDSKTYTHYDPVVAARLNIGEVQCYYGDDTTVYGKFAKELGYIYYDDIILRKDCSTEQIADIEKQKLKDMLKSMEYSLKEDLKYVDREIKEKIEERNIIIKKLIYIKNI